MPQNKNTFGGKFDKNLIGGFSDAIDKQSRSFQKSNGNPFDFTPADKSIDSEIRYYNQESLWARWRRGYELYTLTQTVFGSKATGRNSRGDFRMYCAFQQFPNVFIPARLFTFPSSDVDIGEHMVGVRDTNSFNFYSFGLPIDAVRYLEGGKSSTYLQNGTLLTVSASNHGFKTGDNVYIKINSGAALSETLQVTVLNADTFTAVAGASLTTSGNATSQKISSFESPDWVEQRVKIRFIPTPVNFFAGERLADRVIERDPGIFCTYERDAGTTVTVTCSAEHGLSTGTEVLLAVLSGQAQSGLFEVSVLDENRFTVQNYEVGITAGTLILNRRLRGYDYLDYVGYTVTGTDADTNEILFQRDDSYGSTEVNARSSIVVPAHRGFIPGRYLTTEIRYQCTCADFMRRENLDVSSEATKRRFPSTPLGSLQPGSRIDRTGTTVNTTDDVGTFSSMKFVNVNNFYQPPTYQDGAEYSYNNLKYYQIRWCKHIYAAMFSIVHDEGNDPIAITAKYIQDGGPNISINAPGHGLGQNTRVQLDITSGNVTSGEFIISEVIDADNFLVIAPVNLTTSGYCTVNNLKNHEYVKAWLYEPNDQPVGAALEKFYVRFHKEFEKTREQLDRMKMMGYGMPWVGAISITGDRNQPVQVGNFTPELATMLMTDSIRRDENGNLDRDGNTKNSTTTKLYMMQKLLNIPIFLLNDAKFGMLDQPLTDYSADFQFAEIDCGTYRNGEPVTSQAEALDCGTYVNGSRTSAPFASIDCGIYINN